MLKKAGKVKKPMHIQADLGKEFYNKTVLDLFEKHNIKHYSVHPLYKAALVERFNRTLREKLNRYFTHHGKKIWFSVLPDIVTTYNNTPHKGIDGKRPVEISNELNFWLRKERGATIPKHTVKRLYPVNSHVRISRLSNNPFRKNFDTFYFYWKSQYGKNSGGYVLSEIPSMFYLRSRKRNI